MPPRLLSTARGDIPTGSQKEEELVETCGAEAKRKMWSPVRQMRAFGLAGAVATGVLLAAAGPARAIEFEPNEIVAVPPGTNAVLGYLYFNHLGEITAASPGGIPDHSAHANQF